ncbi:MAG: RNA polymerase sigma factor [Gemmataceae bacterium]
MLANATDDVAAISERDEALADALARLPRSYRIAIELRQFDQLSFEEIGEVLNTTAEGARKAWARGITKLSEELKSFHAH